MPHRAPESLGQSFADALPDAVDPAAPARGGRQLRPGRGRRRALPDHRHPDEAAYGLFAMVDTDQISTSADEPGLVIRNEDVFIEKVRERVALAEATGHLLSPVLLLQTGRGDELHAALAAAVDAAGAPAVTDVDHVGRTHAIWPCRPAPPRPTLAALAGGGELVVADGNHRSLAAQTGGLPRFLAVITTPGLGGDPALQPAGHRAAGAAGRAAGTGCSAAGADGRPPVDAATSRHGGTVHLYGPGGAYAVELPAAHGGAIVDSMDHALVERLLLARRARPGARATSGSPTSAATTRRRGCAARSTPAGPSLAVLSPR